MLQFSASILQFAAQGEKTGWTYISIPEKLARQIKPGTKKSFRVRGKLDSYPINWVALLPMGGGDFILPLNAAMRKGTGKRKGDTLKVQLTTDDKQPVLNKDLMACLADDPGALKFFKGLAPSHQQYFGKWIDSAKTIPTATKRIAMAVSALASGMGFSEMIREQKKDKHDLLG